MSMIEQHRQQIATLSLCDALEVPRASFYRQLARKASTAPVVTRQLPEHALTEAEQQAVLATLNDPRFMDLAPPQVYARLLEEGCYLCSIRTMYRLLATNNEIRERRAVASHVVYTKPELLAQKPNEVWSWDITKLKGPVKWTYFYLYVIMDIFSRYVVGWMVAHREQDALAKRLIEQSCMKQNIEPGQLTVHADRGSSMKSKAVAHLLADLGITKTHSRPHVSNDNPYSESQFKTLKYCPAFPERFGSIQDARAFSQPFFDWYNKEHRHSGIALMTPEQVHYGLTKKVFNFRSQVLARAFQKNPNRFKGRMPKPFALPEAVWINKPSTDQVVV